MKTVRSALRGVFLSRRAEYAVHIRQLCSENEPEPPKAGSPNRLGNGGGRERQTEPTGLNPLNLRDDSNRPALRHGSLKGGGDQGRVVVGDVVASCVSGAVFIRFAV